jgi:DNA segregation ATPase FtsK/SpoIIIE, S-DNA-T family
MTADSVPVAPLSIWKPVHLGTDELGRRVEVTMAERNMLIGGEPGSGKSVALQLIVAHDALSPDCRLILTDGKRVELGLWRDCAERFIGPSVDDAIDTLHWLQEQIDERTEWLLDHKMRKITPDLGWPVYLMPIDEVAYYSATVGTNTQQKEFNACNRDVVARGRAPGIIPVEATQRPSADIIPTSLRDLFGYRWAFRCSTEASSDTILGHGWANAGYAATEIDPQARGVSWLRAEDGIPRRVKAAYLTDEEIIYLADWAAQARSTHHASDREHVDDAGKVVQLLHKDDAA